MADVEDWAFSADSIDLEGDMTLVLALREGIELKGWKIEFAAGATDELRAMVKRTSASIEVMVRRPYEPSLRIEPGEYLAVPDQLIAIAAPPLLPKGNKEPQASDLAHIETDPQVRNVLRNASGLPLLSAQALAKRPYHFYAVVIGNDPATRASFVRKLNPTKTLDSGKYWFSFGERLAIVEEPLLSLDDHFDLVVTPDGIAVLNQNVFEALFRDAETLVERFPVWAKAFSTIGLDEIQTTILVDRCRRNSRLAGRLRQIYESGHLEKGKVSLNSVFEEADRVAGGRDRFMSNGSLDFGCVDIEMLLKLLNDDLFVGGLSKVTFEAGSKARRN